MTFVIEGLSEPLNYDDIEADDAALIASVMAGTEDRICNFISFLDEDGEDNVIPADKIMLLETALPRSCVCSQVGKEGLPPLFVATD
jgi:hypothetical protein